MTADDHQAVIAEALAALRREYRWDHRSDSSVDIALAALASLTQQLQDAEKSLQWFADEANYDSDGPDHDSKVQAYGQERARAALAAAGTGEALCPQHGAFYAGFSECPSCKAMS